ncbi:DUF4271 domain-containing protein [Flavobacterium silvaticum]|uniref:DUF4271 domain-containing protein n=1 Tax=Flavobacterium silvaticum TaxID=1852020 RepID=A0A972FM19_9FLAO|nr:DUF4271 domain-containing protein [Flavobacterium silvaticum]NMH28554.1 DUF4271 domain-containing protein [Flavobacterium silvaticum]
MNESFLHLRAFTNTDWATAVFLMCFALIAVTRSAFEMRFAEFSRLVISDKYIKVYRDNSNLMSWFNVALFLMHLVSFAFFIQLILSHYGYGEKTDWVLFVRVFTFLGAFILSKFLVEKIIGVCFNGEEFVEQFNLVKVSYRTYLGLFLLPIDIILFYSNNFPQWILSGMIAIILGVNILTYVLSIRSYQNVLIGRLFYFILYLCALEIAPYYFMYYWFTKS